MQALEGGFKGGDRLIVASLGIPKLGGQKDAVAVNPGILNPLADRLFIFVNGGRVDVAVADFNRGFDRLPGNGGRGPEGSVTNRRNGDSVGKGVGTR